MGRSVYFAGPLFTTAERDLNAKVANLLRAAGHIVFLPQECEQRDATAKQIFDSDMRGLSACDSVVACMDGSDPDSGTCWEAGYAVGLGTPVICWRSDIRGEKDFGPYNLMLHQSATRVLDCSWHSAEAIAHRIDEALNAL